MPFKVVKINNYFRVRNTTTGKIGRDKFKERKNAKAQVSNRYRFLKMVKNKTGTK